MKTPPKTIKLAPYLLEIVTDPKELNRIKELEGDFYGFFEESTQRIFLCLEQTATALRVTLIHELNHAIWWIAGFNRTADAGGASPSEETIVDTFANYWLMLMRDNPRLMRFLNEEG